MNSQFQFPFLALGLSILIAPVATAQVAPRGQSLIQEAPTRHFSGDPYLLDIDMVTGKKLGPVENQVILDYEGRELRFQDEQSARTFRSDPTKILEAVNKALVRLQLPFYPMKTCPVSGEVLGEMADPVDLVYRNRLVRLCCSGCKKTFMQDPDKQIALLDAAVIAAQGPTYPMQTCVVSGEKLDGEMGAPFNYVIGNRLVRLCCKGCKEKVDKDPLTYLAKIAEERERKGRSTMKTNGQKTGKPRQEPS